MSEKSGEALLARIVALEDQVKLINLNAKIAKERVDALEGYKVPVVAMEPKQMVNTAKLPTWSESHKEESAKPGDRIPRVNADGSVSESHELEYDGRGWNLTKKDVPRPPAPPVDIEGIALEGPDNEGQ